MNEQDQSPLARIFEDAVKGKKAGPDCDSLGDEAIQMLLDVGVIVCKAPESAPTFLTDFDAVAAGIPAFYVSNLAFTSMTHCYPWHTQAFGISDVKGLEPNEDYEYLCKALRNFFSTVQSGVEGIGCVMLYDGMINFTEVVYIRFNLKGKESFTYVLESKALPLFATVWARAELSEEDKETAIRWTRLPMSNKDMVDRRYRRNVTQIALELPHQWLLLGDDTPFDGLVNGDFQIIESQMATFNKRLCQLLKEATIQSSALVRTVTNKDHSLILGFRATNTYDNIRISLDKIPAKLPNGEINIGENEIVLEDWEPQGAQTVSVVRKIKKYETRINKLIRDTLVHIKDHPYIRKQFAENLRTQLIASSHFIKEVYAIGIDAAQPLVNELAEDIVNKLSAHGGNIGLDLNSWIVYQYHDDNSKPTPLVTDELNFKAEIFEKYLDRFMDYLGAFLQNVKSPYIRPYTHRVLVEEDDGVAIGSVRRG